VEASRTGASISFLGFEPVFPTSLQDNVEKEGHTVQKMKEDLSQSRTAFFEGVRTLHEAYIQSHPAPSGNEEEAPTDAILAALASVLGYARRSCEDISASG
jgi:hypothetical protein